MFLAVPGFYPAATFRVVAGFLCSRLKAMRRGFLFLLLKESAVKWCLTGLIARFRVKPASLRA